MFDPARFGIDFMDNFLSGEVGLMDLGRHKPLAPSHKHINLKESLVPKEDDMDLNKGEQKVKFAHVELMRHDASRSDEPKAGLFRGLKVRADGPGKNSKLAKFVTIGSLETPTDISSFNLETFNVMSLTLKYDDTKELIVFKADAFDQKQALEVLGGLMEELRANDMMVENDPELVDVSKYVEIPPEISGKKTSTLPATTTPRSTTYNNIYGRGGCGFDNSDWKKRQEERQKQEELEKKMRWTPTQIKREGDLPDLKNLKLMRKKVLQIAAGDYEYKLPKAKFEDKEVEAKKTTTSSVEDDCITCVHATGAGFRDTAKPVCNRCVGHNNYDDGTYQWGLVC